MLCSRAASIWKSNGTREVFVSPSPFDENGLFWPIIEMVFDCAETWTGSVGLRRGLLTLLGMLALLHSAAYFASAQNRIDGLVKPQVIDKHDIRFIRLSVMGNHFRAG
jgi:hypothetical protein